MTTRDVISMWTVYDHLRDCPDTFIARRFEILNDSVRPTNDVLMAAALKELREQLPPGLVCFSRIPGDDPVILETWI